MATRKHSKSKVVVLPSIPAIPAVIHRNNLEGEVYNIQGLVAGAYSMLQRYYEEHDDEEDAGQVLCVMRTLRVADERLDELAARVDGLDAAEAALDRESAQREAANG